MVNKYVIIFILLTLTIACKNRTKEKPKDAAKLIREIDKIRLTDLNGQTISLKQYQGKTIFINFWATWCKPCIKEMPLLDSLADNINRQDIGYIYITENGDKSINQFREKHKINSRNFIFINDADIYISSILKDILYLCFYFISFFVTRLFCILYFFVFFQKCSLII